MALLRPLGPLGLALAFALTGCANRAKNGPETGASVAPSAPLPSAQPSSAASEPTAGKSWPSALSAAPSVASPSPSASPPGGVSSVTPQSDSSPETSVEGCLAAAPSEAEPPTRAFFRPAPDKLEVAVEGPAVRVVHQLSHACCLHAETRLEHAGTSVTLVETLSGKACRCRCSSVIRSRVPLPPGERELRVRLEQASDAREVHRQTIVIP